MEAPGDAARDQADESHREHDGERVGRGGERLAGEDLAALAGACEDRLQRAVLALGGDDVAGDERRDQRQAPDRHEEEHDEGHGEAGVADVAAERDVVGSAALDHEDDDEDDRDDDGGAEPEVGALLCEQLGDLPAVDLGDRGHQATAFRSWSLDSPPVSLRKSSSRLAALGHERADGDPGLAERDRERADGILVCLEADVAVGDRRSPRGPVARGRSCAHAPGRSREVGSRCGRSRGGREARRRRRRGRGG